MKRNDRLRLKSEFAFVRRHGRKHVGRQMVLVAAPAPDGMFKSAVVCGRKFSVKAVVRNRVRRLVKESLRLLDGPFSPHHVIVIPRKWIKNRKCPEVREELADLLKRAGILEGDGA